MKKILTVIFTILLLGTLAFLVLQKSKVTINSTGLKITTSFYPMYYFTSIIGGNYINVTNITPPGTEPHDYELTPQDIIKIEESKLLILNGNIEPWTDKIKTELKGKTTQILIAGENISSPTDPHVWLSPKLAKIESEKIANALKTNDPKHLDIYNKNLDSLKTELDKLDTEYKNGLKNCQTRNFVTSHAAFNYLAKDYNLNQIAISGLTPDEEPSLSRLAEIANYAKKNKIKYIFFESLVSPKLSQTLANEVGAKTLVLNPIEGVTDKNSTYLTLMEENLQNLRIALACK